VFWAVLFETWEGLALGPGHRQTRESDWLASSGLSPVLDVEEFGEGGPVVPAVSRDIRDLIRRMSRENLLWASAAFRMAAVTIRDPERKK
jgi:hypothetical protein